MNSNEFANKICNILQDHKAEEVCLIDVKGNSSVTDYHIIASGRSMTHARAVINTVEEEIEKNGVSVSRREGVREGKWAVLDYGDVIVHVFSKETREIYRLEDLYGNGKNVKKF